LIHAAIFAELKRMKETRIYEGYTSNILADDVELSIESGCAAFLMTCLTVGSIGVTSETKAES
jgi:hypothetical protein